jgi:ubiquinone/menaquinone biosynthesis C-methylase UbiE
MSLHHVPDREAAAAEIARVLRPGGRVLLRSTFSDRMPDLKWMRYFPRAREIEMQMFPSSEEVIRVFANAGLTQVALRTESQRLSRKIADAGDLDIRTYV